jgi:hypothetical protein
MFYSADLNFGPEHGNEEHSRTDVGVFKTIGGADPITTTQIVFLLSSGWEILGTLQAPFCF